MSVDEPPWLRRGWNLELIGGAVALVVILVVLWMVRAERTTLELAPGCSTTPQSNGQKDGSTVQRLLLSWDRHPPEPDAEKKVGAAVKRTRIRVESLEQGYLMLVCADRAVLNQIFPETTEAAILPSGIASMDVVYPAKCEMIHGVHCSFPFGFGDLTLIDKHTVTVPDGCEEVLLQRAAPSR